MRLLPILAAFAALPALAHEPPTPDHHMACFQSSRGEPSFLRVEWKDPDRFMILSWPARYKHKLHIGEGEARWCWSAKIEDLQRACDKGGTPVDKGC